MQARAFEPERPGEDRTEFPARQAPRRFDQIGAGQHGLEAVDGNRAIFGRRCQLDGAKEIPAEACLLNGDVKRSLAELAGALQHVFGKHKEDCGGGRPLLGTRSGEQRIEIVAPLEHQVAVDDIDARVREGHALRVRADAFEAPQPPALARGGAQHPRRDVERDHPRAPMETLELAAGVAGAASGIHDDLGLELDVFEPPEEPPAHIGLQDGGPIVAAAGTVEGTAHPAVIEREIVWFPAAPADARRLG